MSVSETNLPDPNVRWIRYVVPALILTGWTVLVKKLIPGIEIVNLVMIYLMINVLIAIRYGQGPSIASAALSVAFFDFFFVPPHLTFAVADAKYFVTFTIMFVVTLLTSRLTLQLRRKTEETHRALMDAERETIISSLLSSVSHDLRTPLTSIAGAASTLSIQENKLSLEDRKKLLETIEGESIRLNRLVENILQITKIESGHIRLRKEKTSLEEIVGSALNRLDPFLKGRPVTTSIPEDLPMVPLDDLLIGQVLVNFLENAIRYTSEGSPIDLRILRDGNQVRVEICDRGSGIPQKDHHRIFEKFYRRGKHDAWGSGLGLAICKGIVKAHKGEIGVRDREGGGSVFYFTLSI